MTEVADPYDPATFTTQAIAEVAKHDARVPEQRERPWPEGAWPTPEQWVEWFLSCNETERLALAYRAIESARDASRCFVANHEGLVERAVAAHGEYQRGWNDALTKVSEGIARGDHYKVADHRGREAG